MATQKNGFENFKSIEPLKKIDLLFNLLELIFQILFLEILKYIIKVKILFLKPKFGKLVLILLILGIFIEL